MSHPCGRRCQHQERLVRDILIRLLGGRCQDGFCFESEQLEIDHPRGRPYSPRSLSRLQRAGQYLFGAFNGDVRLLCRTHNAVDGWKRRGR